MEEGIEERERERELLRGLSLTLTIFIHLVHTGKIRSWDLWPTKNLHQVGGTSCNPPNNKQREKLYLRGCPSPEEGGKRERRTLSPSLHTHSPLPTPLGVGRCVCVWREGGGLLSNSFPSNSVGFLPVSFNGDGRGGLYFSARGEIL